MKEGYKNFTTAVYCTVSDVNHITDLDMFEKEFSHISDPVHVDKVYLEYYRSNEWCTKEHMLEVKEFFNKKGIKTSGGITTSGGPGEGFASLCYSNEEDVEKVRKATELCAETFDELILDDFYFSNCRCEKCIEAKGSKTWREFRMSQKLEVSKNVILKT